VLPRTSTGIYMPAFPPVQDTSVFLQKGLLISITAKMGP
jgi:hypothetical protein